MRATAPWLASLLLHSLFVIGIANLSQTPPQRAKQLSIDFQLAPKLVAGPKESAALAPPAQEVPAQVEQKPLPIKSVPAPPPVPVVQEVAPPPMIEPAPPQEVKAIEKLPPVDPVPLVESPILASEPSEITETIAAKAAPTVAPLLAEKAASAAQYLQTVTQIRGQVLGKLRYPAMARRMGWCGKLVLGFILCADGSIEGLEVIESSGHKVLDRAAMLAVNANTPFNGNYARTEIRLPINFQLD